MSFFLAAAGPGAACDKDCAACQNTGRAQWISPEKSRASVKMLYTWCKWRRKRP
jgi:hypothetical protein